MSGSGPTRGTVSVIIPTYNRARLLARAIRGVLSQTAADCCEIVVIDDGSTDNTADVVAEFGGRVRYLRQENAGPAAARNAGIQAGGGEFVAFLDADDTWLPDKIERQLAALQGRPEVLLVAGPALDRLADGSLHVRPTAPVATAAPVDFAPHLFEDNFLATTTVMVRRSGLEEVGLFRPDLPQSEDYHLWVRLAGRGPGVLLDRPVAIYTADDPRSLTRNRLELLRANLRVRWLLRRELIRRPDCRASWRRGLAHCLARLRDEYYRDGEFAAAACCGAASLACRPWPPPKWEVGRLLSAVGRALIEPVTNAAHVSHVQRSAAARPRSPSAARARGSRARSLIASASDSAVRAKQHPAPEALTSPAVPEYTCGGSCSGTSTGRAAAMPSRTAFGNVS